MRANEAIEGNHKGRDITKRKKKTYKIQFNVVVFLSVIETDRKSRNFSPSRSLVASERNRHWNLGNADHVLEKLDN